VFSSPILSARFEEVSPIMLSYVSGITSATNVDVALFDNAGTIVVGVGSTNVSGNNLIYLPGLENDFVNLQVGSSTKTLTFTSTGFNVDGSAVSIGGGFELGNKYFTVKGLGGGLIQGGNIPPPPTYSITPSTTNVNEGSSVSFTVNTTDVGAGTTLYYSTNGTANAADFTNNSLTGSFSIVSTGSTTGVGTIVRSIATDFDTESGEQFSITVRTGSTSGPGVTTSSNVIIGDVTPTVNVAESATFVDEGGSVTFTISGSNIGDGTYYYTIYTQQGTISSSDFSPSTEFNLSNLSGSFTISNNNGSFTLNIANDITTEGTDKFKVQIRTGSTSGTIVAESNVVTIGDISKDIGSSSNGLTFGPIQVNRDSGNAANATDWYAICDLDNVPDGSSIALFIDGSGSMTQATVQASYEKFVAKLNERNITITTVTNSDEDWITPFLTDLP
jgi:hypothetical protein